MPGPRKKRPIVIGVASDLHCGSTVAVCPDEGLPLDDGGHYHPSKVQRWLWHCWIDFWSKVGALVAEHEAEFWLVINGDMVDGDHHDTPQIVSRKLNVQEICALKVLALPRSFKPKHTFVVRGTEVHVGKSGDDEEKIARQIGAEQEPDTENHSWWQAMIEANGTLIDFQHHGRRGFRYWTKANAIQMLAAEITASWATEERMPDLAIRSHVHLSADSYDNYPVRAITTPSWQLKTAHIHRIGPESLSDIGGLAIVCHPGGRYDVEKFPYKPKRAPTWRPR